jgi:hypothetical protein
MPSGSASISKNFVLWGWNPSTAPRGSLRFLLFSRDVKSAYRGSWANRRFSTGTMSTQAAGSVIPSTLEAVRRVDDGTPGRYVGGLY